MFNLLDIAWPGRNPHRPIIIEPDTVRVVRPKIDSVAAPEVKDSILPQEFIDSCKESVTDTLHSAINWLNGSGIDGGHTSLLWTSLVVLASLSLCFYFVWSYRRQLQRKSTL